MESMLYQGHRFLGGIKHFWMAVGVWKTNLVLEGLARQKRTKNVTKVRDLVRSDRSLTVRMISSVTEFESPNSPRNFHLRTGHAKKFCGNLDAASRQCSLSRCHLRERIFGQKKVFQWFRGHHTRLVWVRVTSSFSQNSNSTTEVVILELWTTSKRSWQTSWGHFHMKTSSTATGSWSNVSGGVWLPKGTTLKGISLIYR